MRKKGLSIDTSSNRSLLAVDRRSSFKSDKGGGEEIVIPITSPSGRSLLRRTSVSSLSSLSSPKHGHTSAAIPVPGSNRNGSQRNIYGSYFAQASELQIKLGSLHSSLIDEINRHTTAVKNNQEMTRNSFSFTRGGDSDSLMNFGGLGGTAVAPSSAMKVTPLWLEKDKKLKVTKQRTMFLKAALQLLDERDDAVEDENEMSEGTILTPLQHILSSTSSHPTSPNALSPKTTKSSHSRSNSLSWATSPILENKRKQASLPEDDIVIMSGMLKKGKDSTISRFKFKHVVLMNSSLLWFPNKQSFSDYEKEQRVKRESKWAGHKESAGMALLKHSTPSILLDGYAMCERAEDPKYLNRHIFVVWNNRDLSSRRLWMCKSDEECNEWVEAIRKTIEISKAKLGDDVADIDKIHSVQAMMNKVEKEEDYIAIIEECAKIQHFNIPVAWIHQTKSRPMVRGGKKFMI
jgi:hypothetical protein